MSTHELKTWPQFFARIVDGSKAFELRKADRDFQEGDTLVLREYSPDSWTYTGRSESRRITYVLRDDGPSFGLAPGYCILGISGSPVVSPEGSPTSTSVPVPGEVLRGTMRLANNARDGNGDVKVSGELLHQICRTANHWHAKAEPEDPTAPKMVRSSPEGRTTSAMAAKALEFVREMAFAEAERTGKVADVHAVLPILWDAVNALSAPPESAGAPTLISELTRIRALCDEERSDDSVLDDVTSELEELLYTFAVPSGESAGATTPDAKKRRAE